MTLLTAEVKNYLDHPFKRYDGQDHNIMLIRIVSTLALIISIISTIGFAHASGEHHSHASSHHGDLMLHDIRIRAVMPGSKVSAGYLDIMNHGQTDDRLLAVSIIGADKAEIHSMIMDNGVMKMRPIKDGLEIPSGEQVSLAPGGYHLMFMKLDNFPKEGELATLTLNFEKAGSITLKAPVVMLTHGHGHSSHSH